ncbi:MAG: SsrA-binding protein SmpB [Candidatus Daviesbacteria bacterium]|nr:SsrA-binding protein SmpB [Candidatus Daviesbacteria bacterium]
MPTRKIQNPTPLRGVHVRNKRASRDYFILESFEAGIRLLGSEVKSVRLGRVTLEQSFARVLGGEAFLVNAHIAPYQHAKDDKYQPARTRQLLLHKKQIDSLNGKLASQGATLIPISIYEKNNLIKVQLGLGKSKKQFDKRRVMKERDHKRRIDQELRGKV